MEIRCEHSHTLMKADTGYTVAIYKAESPLPLPDGSETSKFTAKGYMLPEAAQMKYVLKGEFEKYKRKDGSVTYTLLVQDCKEIQPTEKEAILAYLVTLNGVGKVMAERMYDSFGDNVFHIMETDIAQLTSVKGISKKKAEGINKSYAKKKYARELFQYLYQYRVKDSKVMKLHHAFGADAVSRIKEDPYCITEIAGIGFQTAEAIARKEGYPKDFPSRIEAGILEVLLESEVGGALFRKGTPFPSFMYESFLQQKLFDLLYQDEELNVTGNTYTPRDIAYLMTLKLLDLPLTEQEFDDIILSMHRQRRLFISVHDDGEQRQIRLYRYHTAQVEFSAAKKLVHLSRSKLTCCDDLEKRVYTAERALNIRLSDEQNQAVRSAIVNPVSVITGGPGTGKTAVQKGILSVYKSLYPKSEVLLIAPTGRAARRMSESTGYPASTMHSALALYNDENGDLICREEETMLSFGLIIVDECSMIGTILFEHLLSRILPGTRLVLVGDIDQLPSIEIGAVLREVIGSNVIPVTRLTKTYRQANGSPIAVNAARIKNGVTDLEYQNDFIFLEEGSSQDIAATVAELYKNLTSAYGFDNVICLSAYRKSTESGSNALNQILRSAVRSDIDESTAFIERGGQKIYAGDRIMYTRNSSELANGDVGKLLTITKTSDSLVLTCLFDGRHVTLEEEDTNFIDLAYATTVHKSQGSEYQVVVLVTDERHINMLRRNLVYTGITRAKSKIYIVGQMDAFHLAIQTQDSVFRRSQLGDLLRKYAATETKKASEEAHQLSMTL